jgi:hypothetical protein
VTDEPELTSPATLTTADGRLDRRAIGWTRRPLHTCPLPGPRGRRKRWDYWCVTTRDGALQVTIADFDYLGLAEAAFVEFATGRVARALLVTPLGLGIRLGDVVGEPIRLRAPHLAIELTADPRGTQLAGRGWTRSGALRAEIAIAPALDSLGVVVPWSDTRFQYTSKHVGLPARGAIELGDRRYEVGESSEAFATLDYGRGVWPTEMTWNWGAGAGRRAGRLLALQLGGRWTAGTGMTENGVFVDGRLAKLGEELRWDYALGSKTPWSVRAPSGAVDLTFQPHVVRRSRIELGFARSQLSLWFGHWRGSVRAHGETLAIDDLPGWAEEHRARW